MNHRYKEDNGRQEFIVKCLLNFLEQMKQQKQSTIQFNRTGLGYDAMMQDYCL